MEMDVERIKAELQSRKDFNALEIFKRIDAENKIFIDCIALSDYLNSKGVYVQDEDAIAFIQRLDKDLDSKLSCKEFVQGILPSSSQYESKALSSSSTENEKTSKKIKSVLMCGTPSHLKISSNNTVCK
eukprot:TRINITY_DN12319_c0_g3_i1.p1 TRINITY_DN12319_c0_g3~~TRINITY_DN12319_c0_g3_i1.p1  ORF type:complete len:129 (-),score=15.40 TRINITY_DN12319_c0_g3_i1:94-480(-)